MGSHAENSDDDPTHTPSCQSSKLQFVFFLVDFIFFGHHVCEGCQGEAGVLSDI